MRLSDFGYDLPPERIAQYPVEPRDASRMLVLRRDDESWEHRRFQDVDSITEEIVTLKERKRREDALRDQVPLITLPETRRTR